MNIMTITNAYSLKLKLSHFTLVKLNMGNVSYTFVSQQLKKEQEIYINQGLNDFTLCSDLDKTLSTVYRQVAAAL